MSKTFNDTRKAVADKKKKVDEETKALAELQASAKADAIAEALALIEEFALTEADIFPALAKPSTTKPATEKPEKPKKAKGKDEVMKVGATYSDGVHTKVYNGKGRMNDWMIEALANGKTLADLEVKPS